MMGGGFNPRGGRSRAHSGLPLYGFANRGKGGGADGGGDNDEKGRGRKECRIEGIVS
jgi:hypothetical protein